MSSAMDATSITIKRPARADARRNFDALLLAARQAFAEHGINASLEDIARRAEVGIGTLYRHFPTREALIEAVYIDSVEDLVRASGEVAGLEPWPALESWLWKFVGLVTAKKVLLDGMNRESATFRLCREAFYDAGRPLLQQAQASGDMRADADIDDVMRLIGGVAGVAFPTDDQRQRVLALAIDGLRLRGA